MFKRKQPVTRSDGTNMWGAMEVRSRVRRSIREVRLGPTHADLIAPNGQILRS